MSVLLGKLPTTVTINSAEVPINTDFRVGIQFEALITEGVISEETVLDGLQLYYNEEPSDGNQAIEQMLWFYHGGKEPLKGGKKSREQIYSYDHDYDYIYAAFVEQYNIDLVEVEYLHWWKFRAMFASLKEDTMIEKVMAYRGMDTSGMEPEQRREWDRMKKIHRIPKKVSREERQQVDAVMEALMNGGDVAALLSKE